jgi:hypothetical protein
MISEINANTWTKRKDILANGGKDRAEIPNMIIFTQSSNTDDDDHGDLIYLVSQLVSFSGWGETEPTWYVGHCWPIVPAPDDR